MEIKRVGILRGGDTDYYENSLQKGGEIISYLLGNLSEQYKPIDIFIDKEGVWHFSGVPIMPADLIHKVDVVWNVAHPSFSKILDDLSIPNIGVNPFSSVFENNRSMLEEHAKSIEIKMPRHLILPVYQKDFDGPRERYSIKKAKEVHEKFQAPWIIKSLTPDLNIGVHVAETFPELVNAIEDLVKHEKSILVEELITGKNVFMHTVSGFRGQNIYSFPVENFSKSEKEKLTTLAENLHQHLSVSNYLKSNFVLSPQKGIYLTSVEFHPDLKEDSHFNKMCESVGAKAHHIVDHLIESSLCYNK